MGATLGLRASPTACRTGGQLSSPKSAGTQVQLGRRSCFFFARGRADQLYCVKEHKMADLVSSSLYCLYSVYSNSSSQAGSQQFSCTAHCIQCAVHLNWFIHFSSRQIQFTKARVTKPLQFYTIAPDPNCGMLTGRLSSGKLGL